MLTHSFCFQSLCQMIFYFKCLPCLDSMNKAHPAEKVTWRDAFTATFHVCDLFTASQESAVWGNMLVTKMTVVQFSFLLLLSLSPTPISAWNSWRSSCLCLCLPSASMAAMHWQHQILSLTLFGNHLVCSKFNIDIKSKPHYLIS